MVQLKPVDYDPFTAIVQGAANLAGTLFNPAGAGMNAAPAVEQAAVEAATPVVEGIQRIDDAVAGRAPITTEELVKPVADIALATTGGSALAAAPVKNAVGAGVRTAAKKVPFPQVVDDVPAAVKQAPTGATIMPELADRYPEVGDPGVFFKEGGKPAKPGTEPNWRDQPPPEGTYYGNVPTGEEVGLSKQLRKAQKRINDGDYEPYFAVDKRIDVDKKHYPASGETVKDRVPKTTKSIEEYAKKTAMPEKAKRLIQYYKAGADDVGAADWYFMGQLEREFIKEYGEVGGRKMFKRKFADQMAATTGGSTPTDNFRNAMYANYQQARGLKASPEASHQLPHPIGGRYVGGNMTQADKMAVEGLTTDNPKRYNFSRNFLGDEEVVTLDEQMANILGHEKKSFNGPEYGPYETLVKKVAKQLGITPRKLQEVAWSGYKMSTDKSFKKAKPMIEIVNEAIERTAAATGVSPEEVVRKGIVRSEMPVYMNAPTAAVGEALAVAPEDEEPDNALTRPPPETSNGLTDAVMEEHYRDGSGA